MLGCSSRAIARVSRWRRSIVPPVQETSGFRPFPASRRNGSAECWDARAARSRASRAGSARSCRPSRRHRASEPSPPAAARDPCPPPRRLRRTPRRRQAGAPRISARGLWRDSASWSRASAPTMLHISPPHHFWRRVVLMIVLRFAHVFVGPLWVGMMVFQIFFLGPTVAELGPDGGKVMGGLMRRRIPIVMPLLGLITIISGLWLFQRDSGGNMGAFMNTPMGKALGWGGLSAILALLIGVIAVRPLMMRMVTQGPTLPAAHDADGDA